MSNSHNTAQANTAEKIAPFAPVPAVPPGKRVPRRARARLKTVADCRAFLATLLREWRSGLLDSQELSRAGSVVHLLSRMIVDEEFERDVAELQDAAATRAKAFRRGQQ